MGPLLIIFYMKHKGAQEEGAEITHCDFDNMMYDKYLT